MLWARRILGSTRLRSYATLRTGLVDHYFFLLYQLLPKVDCHLVPFLHLNNFIFVLVLHPVVQLLLVKIFFLLVLVYESARTALDCKVSSSPLLFPTSHWLLFAELVSLPTQQRTALFPAVHC